MIRPLHQAVGEVVIIGGGDVALGIVDSCQRSGIVVLEGHIGAVFVGLRKLCKSICGTGDEETTEPSPCPI